MTKIEKILWRISGRLPFREISDGNVPYLERYYVGTLLGWRFYLHRFVGSDPDRGLHDHPWARAYSVILSGWYYEHTRAGVRIVTRFNSLTGDTFHRVVLPKDSSTGRELPCWTLFFHRVGDVKPWGFLRSTIARKSVDQYFQVLDVFEPYKYEREGNQKQWWKTAKRRGQ